MFLIDGISSHSYQKQRLILPNGDPTLLTIQYKPQQLGWFVTEITYDPTDFILKGLRIVTSPNFIFQWKNKVPFGIACYTLNNQEPTQQQDFSSGFAKLYLLSEEEVRTLTEYISGQARP
jgi:hypothetical protein